MHQVSHTAYKANTGLLKSFGFQFADEIVSSVGRFILKQKEKKKRKETRKKNGFSDPLIHFMAKIHVFILKQKDKKEKKKKREKNGSDLRSPDPYYGKNTNYTYLYKSTELSPILNQF